MMNRESHYRINVSKHGKHLFACNHVHCRDCLNAYYEIASRFPYHEGYTLDITHWKIEGRGYTAAQLEEIS